MNILPAFILSAVSIASNTALGIWGALIGDDIMIAVFSILKSLGSAWLMLFIIGAVTTVTEWRHIHTDSLRKVLYAFTFPIFMFTYIPISFAALFVKTSWKPIRHTYSLNRMDSRKEAMLTRAGVPDQYRNDIVS